MPYHWPGGYNYLGPGTKDFDKEPINSSDYIAYLHDIAYNNAVVDEDIFEADRAAIRDFLQDWYSDKTKFASLVGASGLAVKNFVEESVLGKPIYGMPPRPPVTPKNWAVIRKINQARKRRAEQEAAAQRDEAEKDKENSDPSKKKSRPSTSRGAASEDGEKSPDELVDDFPEIAVADDLDLANFFDLPMDNNPLTEPQADDAMAGTSSRGGSNSGGGGFMGSSQDVYSGSVQGSHSYIKEFSKSYHFTIGGGLVQWARRDGPMGFANIMKFNSIHGIPWEFLMMYLSEGEIMRLYSNYSMAQVMEVNCKVYSLGVRLPFVTGQSVTTIANSMAQLPIGKFHFDRDFLTGYEPESVQDTLRKCHGTEWKRANLTTTEFNSTFDNITASVANRVLENPLFVYYPFNVENGASQMFPKDVGIYDYVDIKNGSSVYGLCWDETHKPKKGILFAKSSESYTLKVKERGNPALVSYLNKGQFPATFNGAMAGGIGPGANSLYSNSFNTRQPCNFEAPNYYQIQVDNNNVHAAGDSFLNSKAMPKFMIGFVNVRNIANDSTSQGTLLEGKWDIMVKCSIKIKVFDQVQRGYVNRVKENVPFAYNPFFTLTNYDQTELFIPDSGCHTVVHGKRPYARRPVTTGTKEEYDEMIKTYKDWIKKKLISAETLKAEYKEIIEQNKKHPHVYSTEYTDFLKNMNDTNFQ